MMKTWMRQACLWVLVAMGQHASAAAPELVLLTRYQPGMDVSGWYASEKLDGVRAYWNGNQLLSRRGHPFAAPAWFIDKLPDFELDGELWLGRGRFEETQSITSRDTPHPGWNRITYQVFEVPNEPGALADRLQRIKDYIATRDVPHVQVVPQVVVKDHADLMVRFDALEQQGAEGMVLRHPDTTYETGRTRHALKVKRFDDMEATVIGYREGKGKYTGMTGALYVEIAGDRRFYIGSGLSDSDRRNPPVIGSVVTFRYHGFTSNGLPRFASYLRIRSER